MTQSPAHPDKPATRDNPPDQRQDKGANAPDNPINKDKGTSTVPAQKTTADPRPKATQFDGDPQLKGTAHAKSGLGPKDDTPAFLEKKDGPD